VSKPQPCIETIDTAEVATLLNAGKLLLIDVREPEEYAKERIAGALLYPLSSFDADALPDDGERQVVFHCGSGKRSLTAAERRLAAGRTTQLIWPAVSPRGKPRVSPSSMAPRIDRALASLPKKSS